jgi:hypothetical protein
MNYADYNMIYNLKSSRAVKQYGSVRTFGTARAAKVAVAAIVRKSNGTLTKADFLVCTTAYFTEHLDPLVETRNLLNPSAGPIMIRKSELGTCTDPGTETYHCM